MLKNRLLSISALQIRSSISFLEMCVLRHSVMSDTLRHHGLSSPKSPLSVESSRQEYRNGLPFPPPGNLPNPGIKLMSLCLLLWQADSLPLVLTWKPIDLPWGWSAAWEQKASLPLLCPVVPGHPEAILLLPLFLSSNSSLGTGGASHYPTSSSVISEKPLPRLPMPL